MTISHTLNKLLYIGTFAVIILAFSVGYYFCIFLPQKEAKIIEQQKQEQEAFEIPKIDLTVAMQKFEKSIKKDYKTVVYSKLGDESDNKDIAIGEYKLEINDNADKNTFSIFRENKLVSAHDSLDAITEVGSLKLNNTDYYLLQKYSGGAHCCFTWQAVANENGALHVGKEIDLSHTGEQVDKYYFEKDGQLYFLMYDSSFAEFHTSFASSAFFPVFYRIDSKSANFVRSGDEFEKYYQQLAEYMNKEIEKEKQNLETEIDFKLGGTAPTDDIFPSLTCRLIIRMLANGDIETAKKEFIDDSNHFFKDGMIERETANSVADEVVRKVSSYAGQER